MANYSKQREAILNELHSRCDHPTAAQVYEGVRRVIPNISLGTVYRNIALFKENGKAIAVANILGEERLDGDTSPHAHLVCKCCGKIDDIDMPSLILKGEATGFNTDFVAVTYFGTCKDCSEK